MGDPVNKGPYPLGIGQHEAASMEVNDDLISGRDKGGHERFLAIALVCGPPSNGFAWDINASSKFIEMARQLFGLKAMPDVRVLYVNYELWYAREELERLIKAGPPPPKE